MIPDHVPSGLGPDDRVAILSRGGEIHVHPASDDPSAVRADAEGEGSRVLTTHTRDQQEFLDFVASRERDGRDEA
ncbi:MAG: hypothetical protein JWO38_6956 [Gemmataceae bacterium]|nr:hypothetical protein [Gemmataceae bacterium]